MNLEIPGVLLGTGLFVASSYMRGYLKRRGEIAGERSLTAHWREFLVGRWPTRLQGLGTALLIASSAWFLWDMASVTKPATRLDVIRGVSMSIAWSIVIAARGVIAVLDIIERLHAVIARPTE
jgi:hypothetical protein